MIILKENKQQNSQQGMLKESRETRKIKINNNKRAAFTHKMK